MSVDPENLTDTQLTQQRSNDTFDSPKDDENLIINEISKEREWARSHPPPRAAKKNGFIPREVTPNRQDGVRTPLRGEMDSLSPLAHSRKLFSLILNSIENLCFM